MKQNNHNTRSLLNHSLFILFFILSVSQVFSQKYGDPGWEFDSSKYDNRYPEMNSFAKAGVQGGIPYRNTLQIKMQVAPGGSIQQAIDQVADTGGGVVLLKNGTHEIKNTIRLKTRVILRGENKKNTIIEVSIRQKWNGYSSKKNAIEIKNIERSGIEDLTMIYSASKEPIDKIDPTDGDWNWPFWESYQNDPHGLDDLYVRHILIDSKSKNCWIDNCNILKAGSDPLFIAGSNITCRNNLIDQAYNKGGGGNGYYDIRSKYGLFVSETVKRVRHFAVQQGAKYNVVINCNLETDVNFHSKDQGYNLIENNRVFLPTWVAQNRLSGKDFGEGTFSAGCKSCGHTAPGDKNYIYKNEAYAKNKRSEPKDDNAIYSWKEYQFIKTNWAVPNGKTFYAVKRKDGISNNNQIPIGKSIWLQSHNKKYVSAQINVSNVPIKADRNRLGNWEKFNIIDAEDGFVAIQSVENNKYLTADKSLSADAPLVANRTEIGPWEKFVWENLDTNKVALKANANNKYVQAQISIKDAPLKARGTSVQGWETFIWGETVSGKKDINRTVKKELFIHPNPTSDFITISNMTIGDQILIYNLTGSVIDKRIAKSSEETIATSHLNAGLYIVSIVGKSKLQFIKK